MFIIKGIQAGKVFYAKKHLISGIISFVLSENEKHKATKFDKDSGMAEINKYKKRIKNNPCINYEEYFKDTQLILEEVL